MAKPKKRNTDVRGMSLDELAAYRRKLANLANKYIRQMERADIDVKQTAVYHYAYKYLKDDRRQGWSKRKPSAPLRFYESKNPIAGDSEWTQKQREYTEIAHLERFLNAESARVKGYKDIRKRAAQNLKERYGLKTSAEQIDNLLKNGFGFLMHSLGSQEALHLLNSLPDSEKTPDEIMNALDRLSNEDIKDKTIDEVWRDMGFKRAPLDVHEPLKRR